LQTYTTPTGNGPSTGGGQGATDQAKEKAQQATEMAKGQAQQAAGQAKGALSSQVDQRSTQAGEKVGGFASDVRSVGQQLREQGKDQPAKLADQAAERAEKVGSYLTNSDADRILGDLEDFGRRQPWAVIAGGLTLGLVASRFLKASSSRRYEQRYDSSTRLPARQYDVSPSSSGIHAQPVRSGPTVPVTPPADTTLTGGMPAGSPGATAPGQSRIEGSR
jgi:gas vesicle protein